MPNSGYIRWPRARAISTDKALTLEVEAQRALDELWNEKLIPFKLNVGKISKLSGEYIIHFYDSRIWTAHVPLNKGESWAGMVRSAVLARVAKLSGPLKK
jgi:hypothetical protein